MRKIKFTAFMLACLLLLSLLQALLVPKYQTQTPEGSLIGEYYANAGSNDVIFIGDCEVYENFSPVTLWEEFGIPSYIRGSAQQTIWQSYYLLEETLRYETPKVVVFNVLSMQYDTPESTGSQSRREAYNRMTLDSMGWSPSKIKAIFASMTEEESFLTYLFPILRYHDRWSQLTEEDISYLFRKAPVGVGGYLMQTGVKPFTDPYAQPTPADYAFGDNSWEYLDKIVSLCEEKGIKLILIKAPSLYPVWWGEWEAQIRQYASERSLDYVNLLQHMDTIGIDWHTDSYDAGLHLNVYGAEKLSVWFGQYLKEACSLPDRREEPALSAKWEELTADYYRRRNGQKGESS